MAEPRPIPPPTRRGRKPKPEREVSKASKRKRHQRKVEAAVRLDVSLRAEAEHAAEGFRYQGREWEKLGEEFVRAAERLKRNR